MPKVNVNLSSKEVDDIVLEHLVRTYGFSRRDSLVVMTWEDDHAIDITVTDKETFAKLTAVDSDRPDWTITTGDAERST